MPHSPRLKVLNEVVCMLGKLSLNQFEFCLTFFTLAHTFLLLYPLISCVALCEFINVFDEDIFGVLVARLFSPPHHECVWPRDVEKITLADANGFSMANRFYYFHPLLLLLKIHVHSRQVSSLTTHMV